MKIFRLHYKDGVIDIEAENLYDLLNKAEVEYLYNTQFNSIYKIELLQPNDNEKQ